MAGRGRPTVRIKISGAEQKTLLGWARRHKSAQALALRSRIVLACAEGRTDTDVAGMPSPWAQCRRSVAAFCGLS